MRKYKLVINADILDKVCKGHEYAHEFLNMSRNHKVCVNQTILKEYNPIINSRSCMKSDFLKEWIQELFKKFFVTINVEYEGRFCIRKRCKEQCRLGRKVMIIFLTTQKAEALLVAEEFHFERARLCIEGVGTKLFCVGDALEYIC